MNKWAIVGAWVLVAALATGLTWQIVSAADAQVSERPPLQAVPAPSISGSATSGPATSSSSSSSTTTVPATSSSGTTADTGSSSTSAPPVTEASWSSRTIRTGGGVVVVSYRPDEVVLGSAAPAAGFAANIKKSAPEVDVEFESEAAKYRVRARWEGGDLSVEVDSDAD